MTVDYRNIGRNSEQEVVVDNNNYQTSGKVLSAGSKVLRNAYMLLAISMIPAVAGSWAGYNFFPINILATSPIISILVFFGVFYGMIFAIEKNNTSSVGIILLQIFTFMLGFMTGPLLMVAATLANGWQLVSVAFGGTAVIFFSMATAATMFKKPLTGLGNFLFVGVIILLIGIVASIFLQIPALHMALTCGILLISVLLMLWRINMAYHTGQYNYISLTLGLVIDLYNVFVSLLRLLLVFAGNRD